MKPELAGLGIALRRMLLWGLGALYLDVAWVIWKMGAGHDSYAYWWAWHHHPMYGIAPGHFAAFLYSPLFAQVIWPLAHLPWPAFFWIWTVGEFTVFVWLLWPLHWRNRIPLLCLCVPEVIGGNVWPLLAVVLVFGFRRPSLWAAALLVKVTSAMGLVWFAWRREWRPLSRALVASAGLIAVSAAISPHLWTAWIHLLIHGGSASTPEFKEAVSIPLAARLPVAVALAAYGARKSRVGFLAAAVAIGSPVFDFSILFSNFFVFAALPRLRECRATPKPAMSPVPALVESVG
jgi:Glycosyltransferase family 87